MGRVKRAGAVGWAAFRETFMTELARNLARGVVAVIGLLALDAARHLIG